MWNGSLCKRSHFEVAPPPWLKNSFDELKGRRGCRLFEDDNREERADSKRRSWAPSCPHKCAPARHCSNQRCIMWLETDTADWSLSPSSPLRVALLPIVSTTPAINLISFNTTSITESSKLSDGGKIRIRLRIGTTSSVITSLHYLFHRLSSHRGSSTVSPRVGAQRSTHFIHPFTFTFRYSCQRNQATKLPMFLFKYVLSVVDRYKTNRSMSCVVHKTKHSHLVHTQNNCAT